MNELLPADLGSRRVTLVVWTIGAVLGTVAVWWLSSYIDTLTALAQTDRQASLHLFRTRVLPALIAVVLVAVASGAVLLRHGLRIMRSARIAGVCFASAGFMIAAVPVVSMAIVLWMLLKG